MEAQLLEQIELYLVQTKLSPTRFGRIAITISSGKQTLFPLSLAWVSFLPASPLQILDHVPLLGDDFDVAEKLIVVPTYTNWENGSKRCRNL